MHFLPISSVSEKGRKTLTSKQRRKVCKREKTRSISTLKMYFLNLGVGYNLFFMRSQDREDCNYLLRLRENNSILKLYHLGNHLMHLQKIVALSNSDIHNLVSTLLSFFVSPLHTYKHFFAFILHECISYFLSNRVQTHCFQIIY